MKDLPEDLREAVEYGVESVRLLYGLSDSDCQDLRQDLCVEILTKTIPNKPKPWARRVAFRWAGKLSWSQDNRQRLELEAAHGKPVSATRRGDDWFPTWYPPCDGAEEFAPLACREARVMHVKSSAVCRPNVVEIALLAAIDARRK